MGNMDDLKRFNMKATEEIQTAEAHLNLAKEYMEDFGNINFNYQFLRAFMPEGKDDWELDTVHDILLGLEEITEELAEQLVDIFGKDKEFWLQCKS